jgi:hypothetical protein
MDTANPTAPISVDVMAARLCITPAQLAAEALRESGGDVLLAGARWGLNDRSLLRWKARLTETDAEVGCG